MTEFEKLDRVNQDIGAYNPRPRYVDLLLGIGGNFPQWHSYIAQQWLLARCCVIPAASSGSVLGASYRATMGGRTVEARPP